MLTQNQIYAASARVIIAGSRTFNNYELLMDTMDYHFSGECSINDIEIVSGTARGADQLGERWANQCKLDIKRFPAEWDRYGKSAGYKRNAVMADYATHLVAFWDGQSRGTKHMIDLANAKGLEVITVKYA